MNEQPKPFDKHPAFKIWQEQPFNGGPPLELLRQSFVTPERLFYVRNHGGVAEVDPAQYRLIVDGLVKCGLRLSLDDLKKLPRTTLLATMQCAGNRRSELFTVEPIPGEVPWGAEAIGNAEWTGVPLREVLLAAGVKDGALHVEFTGLDEVEKQGKRFGFGGSIPLEKAMSPEVLLAYEMNGAPLSPIHGFPLRLLAPGDIGARSVKWLSHITLLSHPSENFFQAHAYKLFPSDVRLENANWEEGTMIEQFWVNTVICSPSEGATLAAGRNVVEGYSITTCPHRIERVEVYVDRGEPAESAEYQATMAELGEHHPWAWRLWRAELELSPGPCQIVAHAWDSTRGQQPKDPKKVWNFKGYLNNAWHRVHVRVT